MKDSLSIIIPAYNEEKRIGVTLERYCNFFSDLRKRGILETEIVVVLNACKDKTIDVVKEYQKNFKWLKYLEFERGGKGFAIIEGFKYSLKLESNLIGFVDADLATGPEVFYELVKKIGNYDGVITSRWKKGSIIKTEQTLLRKIMSRGFNFLVRSILLLPYSDTQCGAKLFKREAIEKVIGEVRAIQWAFDIDLLYKSKRKKFRIREIPTIWEDKRGSKVNIIKTPIKMFSGIIRLRLMYSPFKFIVRVYDKMPERFKIHSW